MDNFLIFITRVLSSISSFLMAEPYVYFLGLSIMVFIIGILGKFFRISR